jgi:lipopolysaccharide transport system permease protein
MSIRKEDMGDGLEPVATALENTSGGVRGLRAAVHRYSALVGFKTYADIRAEAARTYIGLLWWILEPVASMLVYYIVFGYLFDRGGLGYVHFLFVGVVPWRWFNTSLMKGSNSLINSKTLMRQVYIPKAVFPLVALLVDIFKFFVVLLILLIFLNLTGAPVTKMYLVLPFLIALQALFVAGTTLPVAAITPFFPDIRMVVQNVVRLWFFLSGIFYDIGDFSESTQRLFRLNPMVVLLDSYRDILLRGQWPELGPLVFVFGVSSALTFGGIWLLHHFDYDYPKIAF